jgi:outer membrane receptor protein involved in Fe transport
VLTEARSQEKVEPPSPIRLRIEEDTARTQQKERLLELPDVVIYGEDLLVVSRTRGLFEEEVELEKRESRGRLAGRSFGVRVPKLLSRPEVPFAVTRLHAQYGSHRSYRIGFLNSSAIGDSEYDIRLAHLDQGEWVSNSYTKELEADLNLDWNLRDFTFRSGVGFRRAQFGYYGESEDERGTVTQYSTRQHVSLPNGEVELDLSSHGLRSRSGEVRLDIRGEFDHEVESFPFRSRVGYTHAGGNGSMDITTLSLFAHFTPYEWMNETFGLEAFAANAYRTVTPLVEVNMDLGIGLFFRYRSYPEPHTAVDQLAWRRHVKEPRPIAVKHVNSTTAGLWYAFENGLYTQATFSYEDLRDRPFWEHDTCWHVESMNTKRTSMGLGAGVSLADFLQADVSLRHDNYSPDIPYVSDFRIDATVEYVPMTGLKLEGTAVHEGSRSGPAADTLQSYTRFDAGAEKEVSDKLIFFGGVKNLLDTDYEIVPEYVEPGRELYLGLKFFF